MKASFRTRFIPVFTWLFALICMGSASFAQSNAETIRIEGVAAYNSAEILSFAAQVEAQRTGRITAEDLARTVEAIYREDGYFLAEAYVTQDGQTIIVYEGEIDSISIEGVDARTFRLIRAYFEPVLGKPAIKQAEVERVLMLVEDIQSIAATAEITYPEGQENAHIRLVAEQQDRSSGFVTLDHPAREFGDAVTLTFNQEFTSLLTPGDLFRFEATGTLSFDGDQDDLFGSIAYRAPIGGRGTYWEVYLGNAVGGREQTGTLAQTDLEGDTIIMALGHPFIRDVDTYGYGLFELRRSRSDSDVKGVVTDFESAVNVIGASWIYGKALQNGGAFEYAVNLSFGTRTSDAIGFDDGDEDFWHLRAGFGYQQPVGWFGENSSVRAEIWGQYTTDRLPGIEEFYLGGIDDERGYIFAEAQGDSGVSAVIQAGRDFFPESSVVRRYQPYAFIDAGYIENNSPAVSEQSDEFLSSVGLGVNAEFENGIFANSYLAVPLNSGLDTSSGDPAFYLALTKTW